MMILAPISWPGHAVGAPLRVEVLGACMCPSVRSWASEPLRASAPCQVPPDCLEWAFRKPLVLEELLEGGADVICLQECNHYGEGHLAGWLCT